MKSIKMTVALSVVLMTVSCSTVSSISEKISENEYLVSAIEKYNQLDTDGNGKLSLSEVSGKLKEKFSSIDTDGDNSLTLSELKNYKSLLGD